MWDLLLKMLPAYMSSTVKFIGGPVIGTAMELSLFQMWFATVAGMMTTVVLLSMFHAPIKRVGSVLPFAKRKGPVFSPNKRRFVRIWKSWGTPGVAFLTPILFSPIVGTLLTVAFGEKPSRIMICMGLSASFWAFVICLCFGEVVAFFA